MKDHMIEWARFTNSALAFLACLLLARNITARRSDLTSRGVRIGMSTGAVVGVLAYGSFEAATGADFPLRVPLMLIALSALVVSLLGGHTEGMDKQRDAHPDD